MGDMQGKDPWNTAVFAHRGCTEGFVENTLEAFAEAKRLGADGVELDVRLTSDGALAVHHDPLIDGLGPVGLLFRITIPMTSGPLITLALLTFINAWNDYFWPLLIANGPGVRPLTVALGVFEQHVLGVAVALIDFFQALILSDAVFHVDHIVAHLQVAKVGKKPQRVFRIVRNSCNQSRNQNLASDHSPV